MCSSQFINPIWLTDIFTIRFPNGTNLVPLAADDFRTNGHSYFTRIGGLCGFSFTLVLACQNAIFHEEFITATALSRKYSTEKEKLLSKQLVRV